MNKFIIDEGVYRTALVTPGLLIIFAPCNTYLFRIFILLLIQVVNILNTKYPYIVKVFAQFRSEPSPKPSC